MYFNGLLRYLGQIDVSAYQKEVNSLIDNIRYPTDFTSKISVFEQSNWAIIERVFGDEPNTSKGYLSPSPEYYRLVNYVVELLGGNYFVVMSQMAWLHPGQVVDKHVDLQKVYAETRRVHIQIEQSDCASMSVFAGECEYKFVQAVGSIYELNNRTFHSAVNKGNSRYSILVLDLARTDQLFSAADNITKDINVPDSTNLPVWCDHVFT